MPVVWHERQNPHPGTKEDLEESAVFLDPFEDSTVSTIVISLEYTSSFRIAFGSIPGFHDLKLRHRIR